MNTPNHSPSFLPQIYGQKEILSALFKRHFLHPVSIWVDTVPTLFPFKSKEPGEVRILILVEPEAITHLRRPTLNQAAFFDHILTFDDEILAHIPHASLLEYGSSWMSPMEIEKTFSVSMILGFKRDATGHKMRHNVMKRRHQFTVPTAFFISDWGGGLRWAFEKKKYLKEGFPILGASKTPLFESMFSLAIENSKEPYYFSEKLLDCFMTGTVPLYWGASKIDSYFNPKGIISFSDPDELVQIANQLTPDDFFNRKEAIIENAKLALEYASYEKRAAEKVLALLGLANQGNISA
jgi:hypothetical protein